MSVVNSRGGRFFVPGRLCAGTGVDRGALATQCLHSGGHDSQYKGDAVDKSLEQRVREHLCQVFGLGLEDVQELFEIGHGTVMEVMGRLDGAFARGDVQEMIDASHMLKGTLFNMGLTELGEAARSLEMAGKEGRLDEIGSVYPALRRALENF